MPPTQDSKTTFKPNLTCIFLPTRARYIMSNPDGWPCRYFSFGRVPVFWWSTFLSGEYPSFEGSLKSGCFCLPKPIFWGSTHLLREYLSFGVVPIFRGILKSWHLWVLVFWGSTCLLEKYLSFEGSLKSGHQFLRQIRLFFEVVPVFWGSTQLLGHYLSFGGVPIIRGKSDVWTSLGTQTPSLGTRHLGKYPSFRGVPIIRGKSEVWTSLSTQTPSLGTRLLGEYHNFGGVPVFEEVPIFRGKSEIWTSLGTKTHLWVLVFWGSTHLSGEVWSLDISFESKLGYSKSLISQKIHKITYIL